MVFKEKIKVYPKGKPYPPYPETAKVIIKQKSRAYWDSPEGLLQRQLQSEKMKGENNPNYGRVYTEEERQIKSAQITGLKRTEQTKTLLSESKKGSKNPWYGKSTNPGLVAAIQAIRINPPMLGKHHTEKTKKKIHDRNLGHGHPQTELAKKLISIGNKGKLLGRAPWNKGVKAKDDSRILTGKDNIFGRVKFFGEANGFFGKRHTEESITKMIKSQRKTFLRKPNIPEQILVDIFKENDLPYKYVGDGQVIIGGKIPDYVNVNGKKQLIEMFGTYWHDIFDVARRTEHFRQYGFDTLVIWEDELINEEQVIAKIKKFNNRRCRNAVLS